jgi:hypothetical protein
MLVAERKEGQGTRAEPKVAYPAQIDPVVDGIDVVKVWILLPDPEKGLRTECMCVVVNLIEADWRDAV